MRFGVALGRSLDSFLDEKVIRNRSNGHSKTQHNSKEGPGMNSDGTPAFHQTLNNCLEGVRKRPAKNS